MDELLDLIRSTVQIDEPIDPDSPLVSSGLIDSFDLVGVLAAIEERFGVEIPVEDISIESFDTPRQMLTWVDGKRP